MLIFLICYLASFISAYYGHHYIAGILCFLPAIYFYYYDYKRTGNLIHLRGLFSLFWLGGMGLSCLKLSHLQTAWSLMTWLSFFFALSGFWLSYEWWERKSKAGKLGRNEVPQNQALYSAIITLTILALGAFLFEAAVLGYIPLFVRGVPHAYSEFHISGVHYVTVSSVLVPGLTVLYFLFMRGRTKKKDFVVVLMLLIALSIPLLCVSRFQLLFSVLLAVFSYIAVKHDIRMRYVITLILLVIPLYLVLTVARSHDIAYLNGIFEMKYQKMPIFITQPYMYIANNYDNFNCLVNLLPQHSLGLRMLFPVWALTGLKFSFPALVHFPLYINKQELTTLTLFYDAYYDFGVVGVLLFSGFLGIAASCLTKRLAHYQNPVSYLLYAQAAVYMVLSFFTTWFSNPTTWFYFGVTVIIWCYCQWKESVKNKNEKESERIR